MNNWGALRCHFVAHLLAYDLLAVELVESKKVQNKPRDQFTQNNEVVTTILYNMHI
jgi:hypothetical protein